MDGRNLVKVLRRCLKVNSTVLELGMGPGKDLDLLARYFQVTGSDNSQVFLDRYWVQNPGANLLFLDAVTMDTNRRFDAIYSNKVLVHLSREQLKKTFHQREGS